MRNENELLFDCKNVILGSFAETCYKFSNNFKIIKA